MSFQAWNRQNSQKLENLIVKVSLYCTLFFFCNLESFNLCQKIRMTFSYPMINQAIHTNAYLWNFDGEKKSNFSSMNELSLFLYRFLIYFHFLFKEIYIISSYTIQKLLPIIPSYFHYNLQLFLFIGMTSNTTKECWN